MARGRPRKTGARYPSGKLKPADTPDLQRIRQAVLTAARDERLESVLGTMYFHERIDKRQAEAGLRFLSDRMAADAALGLPPRSARGQDLNAVSGLVNELEDELSIRRKQRAIAAYDAAEAAIGIGSRQLVAVQWIIIYDRLPDDYQQVLHFQDGLNRLVAHYAAVGRR
jgi:hypothetical protein